MQTSENSSSRNYLETRLERRERGYIAHLQRENTLSSPLYIGLCSPALVPIGTFQTVSLLAWVNRPARMR
jgi:hypothetical protein